MDDTHNPTPPTDTAAPDEPAPERDPRIKRANAEAAKYRVERNAARDQAAALESELASLQQQLADAQTQAQREHLARLQVDAAAAHGLPIELAPRLQGDDAATLADDAARLAALLPVRRQARVGHASTPSPSRAQQIFNRIGGGDQNAFDVLLHQRVGGGAVSDPTEQKVQSKK